MPGSAANPVVLDPFRTIIEVGWGARFIALEISYRADKGWYDSISCSPPEHLITPDDHLSTGLHSYSGTYLSTLGVPIESPTTEQKIQNAYVWKGGEWQSLEWGDYGATMPDLPGSMEEVFAPFTRHDGGFDDPFYLPVPATTMTPPDPDLPVPGYTDLRFDENAASTVDIDFLIELTGSIMCCYHALSPDVTFRARSYTPGSFMPTLSLFFPMDGVSATYLGKTYHPVATKLRPDVPGRVIILLEKA
jgi:hypothetical protein